MSAEHSSAKPLPTLVHGWLVKRDQRPALGTALRGLAHARWLARCTERDAQALAAALLMQTAREAERTLDEARQDATAWREQAAADAAMVRARALDNLDTLVAKCVVQCLSELPLGEEAGPFMALLMRRAQRACRATSGLRFRVHPRQASALHTSSVAPPPGVVEEDESVPLDGCTVVWNEGALTMRLLDLLDRLGHLSDASVAPPTARGPGDSP